MARFIKWTETTGTSKEIRYLNVDHVVQAIYEDDNGRLLITTETDEPVITGQAARDALALLNKRTMP